MDLTVLARSAIIDELASLGQGHVVAALQALPDDEAAALTEQIARIGTPLIAHLRSLALRGSKPRTTDAIEPGAMLELQSQSFPFPRNRAYARAVTRGVDLLRSGKVAALLVAGGQGTRLGFDKPKGLFGLWPNSGETLFEAFATQLRVMADAVRHPIPIYIMTSDATHEETVRAFAKSEFFGLDERDVRFFKQGVCPALDFEGRLLLEGPSDLALAPDGHGGCIPALAESGLLDGMKQRGVEWLSYFQVDNPIVHAIDPGFIGLAAERSSDAALKVVRKVDPAEKVGVFARRGGRPGIVEYTELSDEMAQRREQDGSLAFKAGSIAVHVFRREFLARVAGGLHSDPDLIPLHLARKKVPHWSEGRVVEPAAPNACKFERFIFDALPMGKKVFALEVSRDDEFLPLKSADGPTSPAAVRAGLEKLFALEGLNAPNPTEFARRRAGRLLAGG